MGVQMVVRSKDTGPSSPVGRRGLSLVVLATLILVSTACTKSHRRGDDSPATSEGNERGSPSDRVETRRDPRFPGGDRSVRRGIWVERPQRSGFVSPTALANRVASELPKVERECCGEQRRACRGSEGRVLLKFELAEDGRVRGVQLAESTVGRVDWVECTLGLAEDWRLPAPENGRPTEVYAPIRIRMPVRDESVPDESDAGD